MAEEKEDKKKKGKSDEIDRLLAEIEEIETEGETVEEIEEPLSDDIIEEFMTGGSDDTLVNKLRPDKEFVKQYRDDAMQLFQAMQGGNNQIVPTVRIGGGAQPVATGGYQPFSMEGVSPPPPPPLHAEEEVEEEVEEEDLDQMLTALESPAGEEEEEDGSGVPKWLLGAAGLAAAGLAGRGAYNALRRGAKGAATGGASRGATKMAVGTPLGNANTFTPPRGGMPGQELVPYEQSPATGALPATRAARGPEVGEDSLVGEVVSPGQQGTGAVGSTAPTIIPSERVADYDRPVARALQLGTATPELDSTIPRIGTSAEAVGDTEALTSSDWGTFASIREKLTGGSPNLTREERNLVEAMHPRKLLPAADNATIEDYKTMVRDILAKADMPETLTPIERDLASRFRRIAQGEDPGEVRKAARGITNKMGEDELLTAEDYGTIKRLNPGYEGSRADNLHELESLIQELGDSKGSLTPGQKRSLAALVKKAKNPETKDTNLRKALTKARELKEKLGN